MNKVTVIVDTRDIAEEARKYGEKYPRFRYGQAYFISRPAGLAIVLFYEHGSTFAIITRIRPSAEFPGYFEMVGDEIEYRTPGPELLRMADNMTVDAILAYAVASEVAAV